MLVNLNTIDKLINCLQLQVANLPTYQAAVGSTLADLTAIAAALANLTYIRDYSELIDANKKTVFQIKQAVFAGTPGDSVSAFPVNPVGEFPEVPVLAGELDLARLRNKRFMLGPGYTEEIGIAIGIEQASGDPIPDGDVKPTIEAFAAQSNYTFSLVVANRQNSDMWIVEILRSGSVTWENAGTFTGKAADVTITPTTPGKPEQIQVRVQLRKSNANYGLVSDPTYVTVNP